MDPAPDALGDDSLLNTVVAGRYKLLRRVGEGGMGSVYLAEHLSLRKRVALKFLHPEMSHSPEVVARFNREAIAAASLDHPNIAAAHDFGQTPDGRFFLVMDYVDGKSLRELLDSQGGLCPERALHIARHIANGLQRAHSIEIVHRDLKPENIMLIDRDGDADFAKVIDFGIAKISAAQLGDGAPHLTRAGAIFGTPDYMAPEQCLGGEVDHRADLYALAVITFEMLVGRRPYVHDDVMTLVAQHLSAPIPSVRDNCASSRLPYAVDAVFERALAKSPRQRFDSVRGFVDAFAEALASAPERTPPEITPPERTPPEITPPEITPPEITPVAGPSTSTPTVHLGPKRVAPRALGRVARARRWITGSPARARRVGALLAALTAAAVSVLVLVLALASARGPEVRAVEATGQVPLAQSPTDWHPAALPSESGPIAVGALSISPELSARVEDYRRLPEVAPLVDASGGGGNTRIALLLGISARSPEDPVAQYVLGSALSRLRAPEALECYQRALRQEPAFARDPTLGSEVVRAYTASREAPPLALQFLRGPLAAATFYKLLDVAAGHTSGRARAAALLNDPVFSRWLDPTGRGLIALGAARDCAEKRAAIEALGRDADARALPYLRRINVGTGCGFLGLGHCNTCLAVAVPRALRSIAARAAGESAP